MRYVENVILSDCGGVIGLVDPFPLPDPEDEDPAPEAEVSRAINRAVQTPAEPAL